MAQCQERCISITYKNWLATPPFQLKATGSGPAVEIEVRVRPDAAFFSLSTSIDVRDKRQRNKIQPSVPAMEEHGVVPDVLPKVPPAGVQVKYGDVEVNNGTVLTPTQVKNQPHLAWLAEAGAFYTVCMTDPDAPSRENPKSGECQHWLVVNVPGNDIAGGETLSEYVGSGPRKGTGLHRYVFVVYKQGGKLTCDEPRVPNTSVGPRRCFKINKFAEKYNLELVAGNFFRAEYDSYCDELHKQFKS